MTNVPPPPVTLEQDSPERKKARSYRSFNAFVSGLTLLAVIVYAGLTAWQAYLTNQIVTLTRQDFEASNRPYVGTEEIGINYLEHGANGAIVPTPTATPKTLEMVLNPAIKNFGPVPGKNFTARWRTFVGDERIPMRSLKDNPSTIYPTETVHLGGSIDAAHLKDILAEKKRLIIYLTISYDGPSGQHQECQMHQFDPVLNSFLDSGPCDK